MFLSLKSDAKIRTFPDAAKFIFSPPHPATQYLTLQRVIVTNNNIIMSTQQIQQTLAEYFATQPVLKAWLFGSYARGEQREDSDIDILVTLDKSQPIGLRFFGMYADLKELLGREVDLVSEGTLKPFAVESANRDKILIYERA